MFPLVGLLLRVAGLLCGVAALTAVYGPGGLGLGAAMLFGAGWLLEVRR